MKQHHLHTKLLYLVMVTLLLFGTEHVQAQKKKKRKSKKETTEQVDSIDKTKTIKELTKKSQFIDGLFAIYRDTIDGSTQMLIRKDQIGKEYIYFSQISDAVVEAGAFRGSYNSSKIFKIQKHYNKIEFIQQNHAFYFDPENPLSKSANANISEGVLASLTIEATDKENGTYLVKSDNLFVKETFEQIKAPNFPKQSPFSFKVGNLDKEKTKISSIKNYPDNTNVNTHYVYSKSSVLNGGSSAVTDGRNVTIKVEHSLIAMPQNEYQPRYDDPRIGYFLTQVNDMTSTSPTPYRDLIHRWNLIKKNPNASLSDPITPITWWIENTTPIEFRETIKEAVLEWNKAFEQAGFTNAIVVKVQPDDAKWDAGDIRYNVLRWTSSPNPPFGGYGPSFVNPRTGQILGADIMLEYVYHTNRVKLDKLFDLAASAEVKPFESPKFKTKAHTYCSLGHLIQENSLFGHTLLMTNNANENEMKGMKKEAMKRLIMHEVGHTLGLNHNMKASQLFSPEQLNDPNFIKGKCLTSSIMDYPAIHVTKDKSNQGQYFSTSIGPYDKWAIEFGYKPVQSDTELKEIGNRSHLPELIFANDADDMRSPGKAIDPRVMTGDLSNDQIAYSIDRMDLVNEMMPKIKGKFSKKGESYQELRQAFYILRNQYGRAADVISRFIGGVYVDRSMVGQDSKLQPYTPVSYKDQKRAMKALSKYVFAPNAFDVPTNLYNHIAMQRRGYNFFAGTEDPKIHDLVLNYQNRILDHILHPNTLQRISDSEIYGNEYKLSEFMTDLNQAIFEADIYGNVNSFRQNLQIAYTKRLISILSINKQTKLPKGKYTYASKSMALYNLKKIKSMTSSLSGDQMTKAHKTHLNTIITNAIKDL